MAFNAARLFSPMGSVFELQAILRDDPQNDPQITVNTTMENVPHIYVFLVSHIPRYRPFLRQVHQMTPK